MAAKRSVSIRVTKMEERYCGNPTGRMVYHAEGCDMRQNSMFRGCPLGRGYTESDALSDFAFRANADDGSLKLKVSELNVIARRGY